QRVGEPFGGGLADEELADRVRCVGVGGGHGDAGILGLFQDRRHGVRVVRGDEEGVDVLLDEGAHDLRLGGSIGGGGALIHPGEAQFIGCLLTAGVHRFEVGDALEFRNESNRNVFVSATSCRVSPAGVGVALGAAGDRQRQGGGDSGGRRESSCV